MRVACLEEFPPGDFFNTASFKGVVLQRGFVLEIKVVLLKHNK